MNWILLPINQEIMVSRKAAWTQRQRIVSFWCAFRSPGQVRLCAMIKKTQSVQKVCSRPLQFLPIPADNQIKMMTINDISQLSPLFPTGGLSTHQVPTRSSDSFNDSADLSPLAFAAASGLNVAGSSRKVTEEGVEFNFSYEDKRFRSIGASGFMDARSQKLTADFTFELNESVITPGASGNRTFRFQMHLEIQIDSMTQASVRTEKEPLPDFIVRIVKTIGDFARSKNKQISALILDKEDLAELASYEKGKILKDIIALIGIIVDTNRMLDRGKENVALYVKRGKSVMLDVSRQEDKGLTFDLRIDEIETSDDEMQGLDGATMEPEKNLNSGDSVAGPSMQSMDSK
jgi:hypothetical protein